jgi:hypothetical protein
MGMTTYRRFLFAALALATAGCSTIAKHEAGLPPRFETPQAAADALIRACKDQNTSQMVALFGQQYRDLVSTGDAADDKANCDTFVKASDEITRLDPWGQDLAVMVVGRDDFPMAVPIVKDAKGWYFDGAAGVEEIHRRRVGEDELAAIATCRVWARNGATPPETWKGYRYRALPAGKKGGRALIASPIDYRKSGIMTFVVRAKGDVYERDLGADGAATAAAMTTVDPTGWRAVVD